MIVQRLRDFDGSIRELARLAGVSHSTVIDIRGGGRNPTIRTLTKIEKALDYLEYRAKDKTEEVPV